ncbi:MAG: hypothetical protein WEB07_01275 [Natronospirillum sp.]
MTYWTRGLALTTVFALAAPGVMALPGVDLEAGGGATFPSLNGGGFGDEYSLTDSGGSEENLNLSAENGFYLAGRVGVPILPDVKLRYETLNFSNSDFNREFQFGDQTFNAEGEIYLDMSYLDTALVYGIPDLVPGFDYFIDFGVNLRWLLGGVEAEVEGQSERQSEDFPVIPLPSGHLAAGVTIPVANVQLSGELNTLPLDGLSYNDWNVKARWFLPLPINMLAQLGIEAGYRSWIVDIDGSEATWMGADDLKIDFDTSGYFVGTGISF